MILLRVVRPAVQITPFNGGPIDVKQSLKPSKEVLKALGRIRNPTKRSSKLETFVVQFPFGSGAAKLEL